MKTYSQTPENHSNAVPTSIDRWFAKRLHDAPEDERKLIAGFYERSPRSFWNSAIYKLSDGDQGRMIHHLIPTLRKASQENAITTMILIETLRIRFGLPKPGVYSGRYQAGMSMEDMAWLVRENLPTGIEAFENWWGDGSWWPANRFENPLSGTTLEIGAGSA